MEATNRKWLGIGRIAMRQGDIATCYSEPTKAFKELGWKAEYGIEEMCRDSWNWQKKNPNGFK